ncbi:hypothetical protein C8Q70DRAFT_1109735 [Cubamyces menziesii]|nr:hypothetical protein C8Q70DRAFT_1109735 [Cubamyces menziesii]
MTSPPPRERSSLYDVVPLWSAWTGVYSERVSDEYDDASALQSYRSLFELRHHAALLYNPISLLLVVTMGSIVSAIGSAINAIISAIANVLETIVSAIVTVLVAIWDFIIAILCCRCFSRRGTGTRTGYGGTTGTTTGRRRRFGGGFGRRRAAATY